MLALSTLQEDTVPGGARWVAQRAREWSESIEGVSELTRREYAERARWAFAALERTAGVALPPMQITGAHVEALLRDETLAPTTRSTHAFCLRGLLRYCGNPIADPGRTRLWRPPRWVATRRRWATLEENAALLNRARDADARVAIALLGCGLRQDEIIRLRVGDLDRAQGGCVATVRGKGGKLRQVPLTAQAVDALVPSVDGKRPEDRVYPYKRTRLWHDVRTAAVASGVRHLSPHDLRRGFARSYLAVATKAGMNYPDALGSLQAILGHEDPAQTLYYAQPERETAVRGIAAMSLAYESAARGGAP